MKKAMAMILSLAMALSLCACGQKDVPTASGSGSGTGTVSGGSGETYELQIANQLNESDLINVGWNYLKETLEERTDGQIKVTIFPNKALSNSVNEDLEKVQFGVIQMTSVPTSTVASLSGNQGYQVFEMPYLFDSTKEAYDLLNSDLAQGWNAEIESKLGVKLFNGYEIGWYQFSSKKPIHSMADLKGLKVRAMSSDLQIAAIKAVGANPISMAWGEVFTGLQQGTCEGTMTAASFLYNDKFYEVQKGLGVANIMCGMHIPCVNAQWYNSLPEDLRATFDQCVEDWLTFIREKESSADEEFIAKLGEAGMDVYYFEGAEKDALVEAAKTVWDSCADVVGTENMAAVRELLGK